VFTLEADVLEPDLALRPRSYCPACRRDVRGVQSWSKTAASRPIRVGKYGTQYTYTCPVRSCGGVVQPVVRPALDAIDTADLGRRLKDRATVPKPATFRRLEAAVRYLRTDAVRRHHPGVPQKPTGLRVAVLEYRNHCDAASGLEPFSTIPAQGNHHGVVFAPPGYRPGEPLL
jgi:DNA (cytosine-5)-methyltransferase 1